MDWTYSAYTAANATICLGLVIITSIGIIVTFCSSKKGKEFVTDRIIGLDPSKADDENDGDAEDMDKDRTENENKNDVQNGNKDDVEDKKKDDHKKKPIKLIQRYVNAISVFFCILAMITLSIAAVLIFQGCILANTIVSPNSNCPDYPMDCFVFNGTSYAPLTDNKTFQCTPNNNTQFPNGLSNPFAMCYGWIIGLQTTKNVLDQLGICTGLIGLFTTLLAVIVYLGRTIKTIVLCILFMGSCLVAIILLIFFKYSFSPLTYAVLVLGMALGSFGLFLYYVLSKQEKDLRRKSNQSTTNETNVPSDQNLSSTTSPLPTQTSTRRTKFLEQSSKVSPI